MVVFGQRIRSTSNEAPFSTIILHIFSTQEQCPPHERAAPP